MSAENKATLDHLEPSEMREYLDIRQKKFCYEHGIGTRKHMASLETHSDPNVPGILIPGAAMLTWSDFNTHFRGLIKNIGKACNEKSRASGNGTFIRKARESEIENAQDEYHKARIKKNHKNQSAEALDRFEQRDYSADAHMQHMLDFLADGMEHNPITPDIRAEFAGILLQCYKLGDEVGVTWTNGTKEKITAGMAASAPASQTQNPTVTAGDAWRAKSNALSP